MNSWYISTRDEYPVTQVFEYRHPKYKETILSVLIYEDCECEVVTSDYEQPDFIYTRVLGINKEVYGININEYGASKNITSISVTALPWHDIGEIKRFPSDMPQEEKERILNLTEHDVGLHYLLIDDSEGWEEKELGFWLYGSIELLDQVGEFVELIEPRHKD